jgi:hypothetical protein
MSRRLSLVQGLGMGLVLALIAWLSFEGDVRWPLMAGCVVGSVAIASRLFPVESLWLEGAVLVQEQRGKIRRVDLSRLATVKREWVPKKGDDLVLTDSRGTRIAFEDLSETTAELRRAVGERAHVLHASTDLFDRKTKRLLFLD